MNEFMAMGCALLMVVALIGGALWVLRLLVLGANQRTSTDARFDELETQLAQVRSELSQLRAEVGAEPAPGAVSVTAREQETAPPLPVEADAAGGLEEPAEDSSPDLGGSEAPGPDPEPARDEAPPDAPPPKDRSVAPEAPPSRPAIEWEQWLGVRGVAVLGGIVFSLAALYFVRYSIDQGWLSPTVRVALLYAAGVGALGFGEWLRARGHIFPANALQGAGLVAFYVATWAARNRYELIGSGLAFAFFALITVAGGLLAIRHASLVIAVLGLLGGFATPIMVSSGSNSALRLFGYLLILNVGLSAVSRRGRWPMLGALSLLVTVLYQAAWIFGAMEGRLLVGLLVLAVFAAFFLWNGVRELDGDGAHEGTHATAQPLTVLLGALFSPFAFALYFATQADIEGRLLTVGAFLLLLNASASWLGRRLGMPLAPIAAAAATLGIAVVWPVQRNLAAIDNLDALIIVALLPLLHTLATSFTPWRRTNSDRVLWSLPQLVSLAAASLWIPLWHAIHAWEHSEQVWYLLAALLISAAGLYEAWRLWQQDAQDSSSMPRADLRLAVSWSSLAATAVALTAAVHGLLRSGSRSDGILPNPTALAATIALAVFWQVLALRWTSSESGASRRRSIEWGLACLPIAAFLAAAATSFDQPLLAMIGALILAVLLLLSATRLRSGAMVAVAVGALALFQTLHWGSAADSTGSTQVWGLVALAASALLLLFWPGFVPGRDAAWPLSAWRASALAPVLFAPALLAAWSSVVELHSPAIPALLLAAAEIFMLRRAIQRADPGVSNSVQAWFGGCALLFVAAAIPLQLDREWVTVGWALLTLGLVALWTRVDHVGLKLTAIGLGTAVAVRLLANSELLTYHAPRAPFDLPVLGWLLYTVLLPAIALLFAARQLEPLELERRRAWEPFPSPARAWGTAWLGALAIAIAFAWINLTIFDAYATGPRLRLDFDRMPARDLTLSVAWALFAIGLLIAGVMRRSKPLRWSSLAMLFVTIGKVFLYDLGKLQDLYRVASLVGLAISLLAVSVLYQRFVFGATTESASADARGNREAGP